MTTSQPLTEDHSQDEQTCSVRVGHANLIALQENVLRLVTSVIFGVRSCEYWGKRNPDGSWEKTSQDCLPLNMDDSSGEWSMTWPRWGLVSAGAVMELATLEHPMREKGCLYLPTPVTSQDYKPIRQLSPSESDGSHGKTLIGAIGDIFGIANGTGYRLNPLFSELMMGFPPDWTNPD